MADKLKPKFLKSESKQACEICTALAPEEAFLVAASANHVKCLKILYSSSIANITDDKGRTALHLAANNGYADCAAHLLRQSMVIVDAQDRNKATPLHLASMNGWDECVKLLSKKTNRINACRMDDLATPLHLAAQNGHVQCIFPLLKAGAEPTRKDAFALTPFDYAARGGHQSCKRVMQDFTKKPSSTRRPLPELPPTSNLYPPVPASSLPPSPTTPSSFSASSSRLTPPTRPPPPPPVPPPPLSRLARNISLIEAQVSAANDCIICMDAAKSAVLLPCGHANLCFECASDVKRQRRKCPTCQQTIRTVHKIFDN